MAPDPRFGIGACPLLLCPAASSKDTEPSWIGREHIPQLLAAQLGLLGGGEVAHEQRKRLAQLSGRWGDQPVQVELVGGLAHRLAGWVRTRQVVACEPDRSQIGGDAQIEQLLHLDPAGVEAARVGSGYVSAPT